jgi:hypothetical protein
MGLTALLLEPELDSRQRFKTLAEQHGSFNKIVASSTLSEGIERIKLGNNPDIVYISSRFDPVVVSGFIGNSRNFSKDKISPHLMVIGRDNKNVPTKQFELAKPDGFMLEPVVKRDLDSSVKFVESFVPQAIKVSVTTKATQSIDYKTLCLRLGVAVDRGKPGLRDLRALSHKLQKLEDEELNKYFEELIVFCTSKTPPRVMPRGMIKTIR